MAGITNAQRNTGKRRVVRVVTQGTDELQRALNIVKIEKRFENRLIVIGSSGTSLGFSSSEIGGIAKQ